jgi:hypothetical protein
MSTRLPRVAPWVAAFLLAFAVGAWAQATTGRIGGTVKDASGAVMPGVTMTVAEVRTGFAREGVTDADGSYTFVSLPLGSYTVTAALEGFKTASKTGYELVADGRLTLDFELEIGALNEVVTVTSKAEAVNLTSGEVSRTVDRAQVQDMALNGRNYLQLTTMIPGVPQLNNNALDIMTGLGINTSINGSRGNASLLTVDGGFNMDSGSNNSQISNVGVDFIEQVTIKTSNFSAEYGRNSGAAINVVTRSGTNQFHGSAFEYLRREEFDSNDYFNDLRGVKLPQLKYDNYGGSIGGPILKDQLFFFGGVEWKKIRRFTSPATRTLPTSLMRSGNFSQLSATIRDPLTGQPFPGNVIPTNRITADGRAIANVYDAMSKEASFYDDTLVTNNSSFQSANPFDFRQEFIRADYQPSGAHRITVRLLYDHYLLIDPYGTFIGSQLPTIPTERKRPGRNVQANHYWTIGNNKVNEFKFNYSGNGQIIPPVGDAWKRETYGFAFPQLYAGGGDYDNSIPNITVQNYASFSGANASLLSPTKDFAFSDNFTWIKGDHTLKAGGLLIRNHKDQNGRSVYPGQVSFTPTGNTNTTGNAFADALLGNFRSYQEAQLDPIGYFRFWQLEAFASDSWKISPKLSIEYGIRYAYQMPTLTDGRNTTSFDPAMYDPAQAVTMNTNGTIVAGTGNRFNGLTRPGEVPGDQVENVPNANSPLVALVPFAANEGYYANHHTWGPRFSFAYSPTDDGQQSIRGGIGLFYDRPEGNLYFSLVNNPPFALSSEFQNGNLANPGGGAVAPLAPWVSMDALDPGLDIPRVWNWSLSYQRELPWGLFGEVSYIGNRGQHLLRQPDINRPSLQTFADNAAGPNYNTNYLRQYKGYSAIRMRLSDAESSYNALQLFLSKRQGDIYFTVNYTLSKSEDRGSGNGDDQVEDWRDLDYYLGPSDFDRRHILVGTWTYRLPFFRSSQSVAASILGGWEVSGVGRYQSGAPFSVTVNTIAGTRRVDLTGVDPYASNKGDLTAANTIAWLNIAAFAQPANALKGTSSRNQFTGPSYHAWDISLRKAFRLYKESKIQLQADFFNAFNQKNFNNPSANISNSGFGVITGAAPPRQVQLAVKFLF